MATEFSSSINAPAAGMATARMEASARRGSPLAKFHHRRTPLANMTMAATAATRRRLVTSRASSQ